MADAPHDCSETSNVTTGGTLAVSNARQTDHGFRLHQDESRTPARPQLGQSNPEQSIGTWTLSAQNGQLLTQRQIFQYEWQRGSTSRRRVATSFMVVGSKKYNGRKSPRGDHFRTAAPPRAKEREAAEVILAERTAWVGNRCSGLGRNNGHAGSVNWIVKSLIVPKEPQTSYTSRGQK
jgi:hypothetical protein